MCNKIYFICTPKWNKKIDKKLLESQAYYPKNVITKAVRPVPLSCEVWCSVNLKDVEFLDLGTLVVEVSTSETDYIMDWEQNKF